MAQLAAISLLDGKATPIAHMFTPIRNSDSQGILWRDQSVSPIGVADTLSLKSVEMPKLRRLSMTLLRPRAVTETALGVPSIRKGDFMSIAVVVNIPLTWSAADIKDSRLLALNAANNSLLAAAIDTGEIPW